MEERGDAAARVRDAARRFFGFEEFRPGQLEAMASLASGRDTLVVMPTGSGKSAIYQVVGILRHGPTVVVSPLIALQRDQLQALKQTGDEETEAVSVDASKKHGERRDAFDAIEEGDAEFFFLAPEQLANEEVLSSLERARPSLFVVDEAHCISSWGHDFRPDYLRLGDVVERLGHPLVCALTATAAPPVRREIVERLGMVQPAEVVAGFDRPNLYLEVDRFQEETEKRASVVARAVAEAKPGIAYVATRRKTTEYADDLVAAGVRAAAYHAGMKPSDRDRVQEDFMNDEVDVVVATTAFGMGIDKPNVRFVFHADIPDSLDSYYQEIGRAGRDGEPAVAVLFYRSEDVGLRKFFAAGVPERDTLQMVANAIAEPGVVPTEALAEEAGVTTTTLTRLLNLLEETGAIDVADREVRWTGALGSAGEAADAGLEVARSAERVEQSRVDMMRGYAEARGCRRQLLLSYFGEVLAEPCGRCDRCDEGLGEQQPSPEESPYPLNARVTHREWGDGTVMRYEGDRLVVLFDDVGYKTLALDAVQAGGLLRRAS